MCIQIQVNHVEPELRGVFVSVWEGQAGVVKGNLSCQQSLNGKPESGLCNGLYVNKLYIISLSMFVCVSVCSRVRTDNLTYDCP